MAVCAVVIVTFGLTFGEERFNGLIMSWGIGLGQTFAAEEPVIIWIYMLIPVIIAAVSSNDLTAELLNGFMGSAVGEIIGKCIGMCSAFVSS
jgi:hypothetical protein